ncbi:hypothetical protein DL93DRAFT_2072499 [Clavulina sp. PMI_390]|nr:hypothetical protein DL93DRAFT_2072499 [Clavulina sp. PMI_390]
MSILSPTPRDPRLTALLEKGSSRPETPDLESQQGRRNAPARLLDDEGAITTKFERALGHIFAKYASPKPTQLSATNSSSTPSPPDDLLTPPEGSVLDSQGLDRFAEATNGQIFSEEAKEEIQYLDSTPEGFLTFKGFLELYQLQTENDEEETWKDLSTHGFDRNLNLVSTRQSGVDEDKPLPMNELRGIGMGGEQISTV